MKVKFLSLGCKTNQYESNSMEQSFISHGFEITDSLDDADIYVVNTCSVTNVAERKSRQMLRRAKEINEDIIVVACGCYAQVAKEELESLPEIDIVLGTNEKNNIVKTVQDFIDNREKERKVSLVSDVLHQGEYQEFGTTTYTELTRAVIKIQDGCDRFCTYCIIPYARGKVRSRRKEEILKEIEANVKEGIQEVVLTGIHIASYGKDFEEHYELIDLLEDINKIENLKRIRFGSIEPKYITEDVVKRLKNLDKLCDHFHLSLQSGCDETLKRMNRRYTTEEFKESVNLLRKAFPNVALTTDVIVGFPGETEEEFNKTYNFLKEINFYEMHVFKYSPRRGTAAEKMPNQVPGNIKEERSKKLLELSTNNEQNFNKKYIGKEVEVLFEERENEYFKGHTTNYILVYTKTDEDLENKMLKLTIKEIKDNKVIAE